MRHIEAEAFANAAAISSRAARKALHRGTWNGFVLPVVQLEKQRGGAAGRTWGLDLDRCSPELLSRLALDPDNETSHRPFNTPFEGWQIAEQQARWRIIQPILKAKKGSRERAELTRDAAARQHDFPGGVQSFAYDTLRGWVADFDRDGFSGLIPKARSDRGQRRVQVTRLWDAEIDLPEDRRDELAARIMLEARSMVANDGTSDREVLRLCGLRLAAYCADAGSELALPRLQAICKLNQKWADRAGLAAFRLVHMHDKDHKAWHGTLPERRGEL